MPSAKILETKKAVVAKLAKKLKNSCAGVVVSYKGINVEDDTNLRRELREAGIEYMVTKNTLLKRAAEDAQIGELTPVLEGSTAIALSENDHIAASRILCKFSDSHDFYQIKSGFIDGNIIDEKEVHRLAKLPSREVLITQVLGGLNAPISGFANVLSGTMRGLVVALGAIAEKQKSA